MSLFEVLALDAGAGPFEVASCTTFSDCVLGSLAEVFGWGMPGHASHGDGAIQGNGGGCHQYGFCAMFVVPPGEVVGYWDHPGDCERTREYRCQLVGMGGGGGMSLFCGADALAGPPAEKELD